MAAVLAVLKVVGIVLLALMALLLLVLAVPVTVDALYEKGVVTAGVRLFGIRVALLPKKKEKRNAKAKSGRQTVKEAPAEPAAVPDNAETPASDGEDTAAAAAGTVQQLKTYLDPAKRGIRFLLRHMRLHDVTFVFNVRSADAAEVGMRCGIMWGFVGGLMRTLAFLFGERVKYGEVTVMPCFHPDDGARERFGCKITASPIIIVVAAAVFWRQLKKSENSSVH